MIDMRADGFGGDLHAQQPRRGFRDLSPFDGRRSRSMVEPRRGPWSAGEAVPKAAIGPTGSTRVAKMDAGGLSAAGDTWAWLAVYLGQYPEGVAIPRQVLRDIADKRWIDVGNGPLPVSRARKLRLRAGGAAAVPAATKGRRSSQKLATHLRSFEELGLVRRDNMRDAVIIADPDGLRRLGDALASESQGHADQ